jgi:hypothetical protein
MSLLPLRGEGARDDAGWRVIGLRVGWTELALAGCALAIALFAGICSGL